MNIRIKSLCKRAKKGNKDTACQLIKIYYADIYAHLRRLCGSKQDAEDLTQQTFIQVCHRAENYDGFVPSTKMNEKILIIEDEEDLVEEIDGNDNLLHSFTFI